MTTRRRREKTAAGAFEVNTVRFEDDGLEAPPKSPPKAPARGKTVKGYILTAEDDLDHSDAVIVPSLRFQDLRRAKSSELPLPASPVWRLHEIEYSTDEGTYIAAVPLGSVYIAQGAGTVFVRAASLADVWGQI